MSNHQITVAIDWENNTETWWDALREQSPKLHELFFMVDKLTITCEQFRQLTELPGWADGPPYAKHPIVVVNS
jgi:hypothetical protein